MPATSHAWVPGQKFTSADMNAWCVPQRGLKGPATARTLTSTSPDPDLQVSLLPSSWYAVELQCFYLCSAGNLAFNFPIPGGATFYYSAVLFNTGAALTITDHTASDVVVAYGGQVNPAFSCDGLISTISGGVLAFSWASDTTGATAQVLTGSALTAYKVG